MARGRGGGKGEGRWQGGGEVARGRGGGKGEGEVAREGSRGAPTTKVNMQRDVTIYLQTGYEGHVST